MQSLIPWMHHWLLVDLSATVDVFNLLFFITTRDCGVVIYSVTSVFMSVCVCVCVYVSIRVLTFESLGVETSFLLRRYVFRISRSRSSIKVIG